MIRNSDIREGNKSLFCSSFVIRLYRLSKRKWFRWLLRSLVLRMENGAAYSLTIREIYRKFHGVDVGLYTIGPCEGEPGNLAPGTTVGRYSSIYYTVRTIACDYPVNTKSTNGLFFDAALDEAELDDPAATKVVIGNDVFIGHNAIILPFVEQIGDGAVIGAGSVVHTSVPPYAVVTGNPARVVRYRFSEQKITELLDSKWWLKSIDELGGQIEEFRKPLEAVGPVR